MSYFCRRWWSSCVHDPHTIPIRAPALASAQPSVPTEIVLNLVSYENGRENSSKIASSEKQCTSHLVENNWVDLQNMVRYLTHARCAQLQTRGMLQNAHRFLGRQNALSGARPQLLLLEVRPLEVPRSSRYPACLQLKSPLAQHIYYCVDELSITSVTLPVSKTSHSWKVRWFDRTRIAYIPRGWCASVSSTAMKHKASKRSPQCAAISRALWHVSGYAPLIADAESARLVLSRWQFAKSRP